MQLDNASDNLKGASTTLTAHGDGTFHTEGDYGGGKRAEHASIGHALMHVAKLHSTGDHLHVHATEDGKLIAHQVDEGGRIQGPAELKTVKALKAHVAQFAEDDGAEGAD